MSTSLSVILIDDDIFNREHWETLLRSLDYHPFATVEELARHLQGRPPLPGTLVFLDYELKDGTRAPENVQNILAMGFQTVFISTAYDPRMIPAIAGVSGVVSKEPPAWLFPSAKSVKLSAEERRALMDKMDAKARERLKLRLETYQAAMFEGKRVLPEVIADLWERAIFEDVPESELKKQFEGWYARK